VGAEIDDALFPPDPELERAAAHLGLPLDALRLGPSDDYELLLAIDPARWDAMASIARDHEAPLTTVGRFTVRAGEIVRAGGGERPLPGRGFDHFAAPPEPGIR
jgi:thiamine monophosphate kinase